MDWKKKVTEMIESYIEEYVAAGRTAMRWGAPLVGFGDAKSPEFARLRPLVHEEHAMPEDLLPGASIVVSYFLPYPPEIPETNCDADGPASSEWAMAYRETNILFSRLNEAVTEELRTLDQNGSPCRKTGLPAVRAALPLSFASMDDETVTSRWSQRHVARIAGLGTFGLNNMLITEKGCCGRYSSFITDLQAPADDVLREEACLSRRFGEDACGLCVKRCYVGALTADGFDRFICSDVCGINQQFHDPDMKYGVDSSVCGKCLIGLPCTFRRP